MASMDEFSILPVEPESEDFVHAATSGQFPVSLVISSPQPEKPEPPGGAPPLSALRLLLWGPLRGERDPQDQWEYAVSARWLETLRASLEEPETTDGAAQAVPPMYLEASTSSTGAKEEAALRYVGEGFWLRLVTWFGVCSDYQLQRRPMHCTYINVSPPSSPPAHLLTDNKADTLRVVVRPFTEHSSSPPSTPTLTCYVWDHLHFLLVQVKRVLKLPSATPVRLWCQFWEEGSSVFLQEVGERDCASLGHFLCSRHAMLVPALSERQRLPEEGNGSRASFQSLASQRCSLTELFLQFKWSVALWVEECPPSLAPTPPSLTHAHAPPVVISHGHVDPLALGRLLDSPPVSGCREWDAQLSESLQNFHLSMERSWESVKDASVQSAQQVVRAKMSQLYLREQKLESREATVKEREQKAYQLEEELRKRETELNQKTAKFKVALTDFLVQKNRLEAEMRKIESTNQIADSKVTLNVGGTVFSTSTVTLQKEKDSLLALMFSGRHKLQCQPDGSYFIDRDGTHFRYILNFLRDGERALDSLPANTRLLSHLVTEAEYFQMPRLASMLRARLANPQNAGGFQSM